VTIEGMLMADAGAGAAARPSFGEFVATRSVGLQRFAYLVTGNVEDARDAVQDALIGVYPRWSQVVGRGDPEAYVRRSIVNSHISRWRRGARETAWDPSWFDSSAPEVGIERVDARVAVTFLPELPERQRAAVVLRFYADADYPEIGRACGCSPAAARVLVHRGIAALRQHLSEGSPK
jgi:RNA polymerase sigma factor (sigma-70 family)